MIDKKQAELQILVKYSSNLLEEIIDIKKDVCTSKRNRKLTHEQKIETFMQILFMDAFSKSDIILFSIYAFSVSEEYVYNIYNEIF